MGLEIRSVVSTVGQSLTVEVLNEVTREPFPPGEAVLQVFEDPLQRPNTRTIIRVSELPLPPFRPIEFYWCATGSAGESVGILAIESTRVLFLGAGRFLAVIDLSGSRVIHEHPLQQFWSISHQHASVIVRSELECFLFARDGTLCGSVPVDPPWQEHMDDQGIHFESSVYGRQYLPWSTA
jgi:hypothetical protein